LELVAESTNKAIRFLSAGLLDFGTELDLMPNSLKTNAQQLELMAGKIKAAEAEYTALALRLQSAPENIYIKSELGNLARYIDALRNAQREKMALQGGPSGPVEYGNETRREDARQGDLRMRAEQAKAVEGFWAKNMTPLQKMNAELAAARATMGSLFTPEIEAQIRQNFATPTRAAARAAVDDFTRLSDTLRKDVATGTAQAEAAQHGYNKAQTEFLALAASDVWQNLTADQRAQVAALVAVKIAQEQAADATKALAEAHRAQTLAEAAALRLYTDSATSAERRLQDMRQEAQAMAYAEAHHISLAQAIEHTAVARLREQQAIEMAKGAGMNDSVVLALQAEIDARQQIIGAIASNEVRDASRKLREDQEREWARTWDQVAQSFTDALMQGGKSVKEYLIGLFRTLVLRPILAPIGAGMASMFGGPAAAAGQGGAGGGLSMLGNLHSMYQGVSSGFSGLGASVGSIGASMQYGTAAFSQQSTMLAAQEAGMGTMAGTMGTAASALGGAMVGFMAGKMISGGYSAIGKSGNTAVVAGTAIGMAVAGPIGAAIGGMIGGTVNRLFGRKLKDSGIMGEFGGAGGFSGQQYEFYKGGTFRSDKTKTRAMEAELRDALAEQYQLLADNTTGMAGQLKLSASALETYTRKVKFSTRGLTSEQITQKLQEEFALLGDEMAQLVLGTTQYTRAGEGAAAALARLSTSITASNAMLDVLGLKLFDVGLAGADMASDLADRFGGVDAMAQAATAYYQAFYSAGERAETATRLLTSTMNSLGLGLPTTTSEFRALVDGLDLTTESGRATYAALLKIAPEFSALQAELQRLAEQTAAKLIATFTARGQLVPALDGVALSAATVSKSMAGARVEGASLATGLSTLATRELLVAAASGTLTKDLSATQVKALALATGLTEAQVRAGALAGGVGALGVELSASRLQAASLATGMSSTQIKTLALAAASGTLTKDLSATQVKALALATGLTEAQVRAGALAGGSQSMAAQLAAAAAQALGFAGQVSAIHRLLGDASSGVLLFGKGVTSATADLTPAQTAVAALRGEIFTLRSAASGTVVDMAGLSAALSSVDTRTFVATVVGVFDLIGKRIKDTLDSITDERTALREAAITILGPAVMSVAQIRKQVSGASVGMPTTAGIENSQAKLASADALVQTREKTLTSARSAYASTGANALSKALALESMRAKEAKDLVATYLRFGNVQSGIAGESLPSSMKALATWEDSQSSMLSKLAKVPVAEIQAFADQLSALGSSGLRGGLNSTTAYLKEMDEYRQSVKAESARLAEAASLRAKAADLADKVTTAEKALAAAKTAAATAAKGAQKAQLDYVAALQKYSLDASKAVSQLGRMREETVKYYESQKQLADLMTGTASSLRATVSAFRFDQLDPAAQLANLQERFNVAYSLAMSTTGETLSTYGQEINSLINPLLQKAQEAGVGGSQYSQLVNTVLARAEATAKRLEANAPKDYAAESLGLLGQIDSTLAALEAGAMTADQLIVKAIDAGKDTTRDGLRAVIAALTGKKVPAFATGGMHAGGLRIVGERGPELEVTGPARIYSASDTARMLQGSSSVGDNAALLAELQALRAEVAALRRETVPLHTQTMVNTGKAARQIERWDVEGLSVRNVDGESFVVEAA
jgi:hypothetical protein